MLHGPLRGGIVPETATTYRGGGHRPV